MMLHVFDLMSAVCFHILFTCRNSLLYYKKQNKSALLYSTYASLAEEVQFS